MHATDEIARMMAMDAMKAAPQSSVYTKSETDALLGQKADKSEVTASVAAAVSQIVADAPEDFDTLKEMSDWISSHEDSAAAMNAVISQNAAALASAQEQITALQKIQAISNNISVRSYADTLANGKYCLFTDKENVSDGQPPIKTHYIFDVYVFSNNTARIEALPVGAGGGSVRYVCVKNSGIWRPWCKFSGEEITQGTAQATAQEETQ